MNPPPRTKNSGTYRWFPVIVLLTGLGLTCLATYYGSHSFRLHSQAQFQSSVQHAQATIEERLDAYIALLRGAAGFWAADSAVTREKFHAFADRLRIRENYPGLEGIGYSLRVAAPEKERIVAAVRAQGDPDFRIWPETAGPEYYPTVFLEPPDHRNEAAVGYDMFAEPVRRDAMERARDTGRRAASGKTALVQDTDGFLIFVPVYQGGGVPASVFERRQKLQGFVFDRFRAGDLFTKIFADEPHNVALEIFDGKTPSEEQLLFRTARTNAEAGGFRHRPFQQTESIDVAGRTWTLRFSARPEFETGWWIVPSLLVGGTLLSFVLFFLTRAEARSRAALRESEERFRLILESATDYAIFSTDLSRRVTSWNAGAERMFGFREEEILGQDAALIFTPEDRARRVPEQETKTALETGIAGDDRWHQRKDGSRLYVSGIVRPMHDDLSGKIIGFIKIARDVTERLQAQENLRREKEFSDTLINSLPGVFYLFDHAGKCLRWNDTVEQVTGYSREEILRMKALEFISDRDRRLVAKSIAGTLRLGQATVTAELQAKDGRRVPYLLSGQRITLNGVPCIVGMGVDISERKRAEEELRQTQEKLKQYTAELEQRVAQRTATLAQSVQSLEGVLYHVAHDLRAPLRAMASFTNILLEEYAPKLDEQGQDYARRVVEGAQHMDRLVKDLLAYGRLAHTAVPVSQVDLETEVDSVLGQFSEEIRSRHAVVQVQRPLPPVAANATILHEVVASLLSNALKFVPPGTSPRIRIHAEEKEPGVENRGSRGETASAPDTRLPSPDPRAVRLWVEDAGIGIKPEYHERIFRMFERLHGADTYPGTGIGLAIVRKGVERMGGRVGVESYPGEGSRFWVELPTVHDGQ